MFRFALLVTVPILLAGCGATPLMHQTVPVGSLSPLESPGEPSPSPEPSCGTRPAPTALETSLTFPAVVTPTTLGLLTVRNTSNKAVMLQEGHVLLAQTVQGNNLTSTGVLTAMGLSYTALAPGQAREFKVALGAYVCGHGVIDTTGRIPDGRYQAIARLNVNQGPTVASVADEVNFQAAP